MYFWHRRFRGVAVDRDIGDGPRLQGFGQWISQRQPRRRLLREGRIGPWTGRGKGSDIYVGTFVKGRPDGKGTYTWENGARLEGTFRNGKADGPGVYVSANGVRYEGLFENGKLAALKAVDCPSTKVRSTADRVSSVGGAPGGNPRAGMVASWPRKRVPGRGGRVASRSGRIIAP